MCRTPDGDVRDAHSSTGRDPRRMMPQHELTNDTRRARLQELDEVQRQLDDERHELEKVTDKRLVQARAQTVDLDVVNEDNNTNNTPPHLQPSIIESRGGRRPAPRMLSRASDARGTKDATTAPHAPRSDSRSKDGKLCITLTRL
jgi:hypothetical protein